VWLPLRLCIRFCRSRLTAFLSHGDRVKSEVVSEHGMNAEGVVCENTGQSPSEKEGGPLRAFNGEEVPYEYSEKEGSNPIKDAHIENLWFTEALNGGTGWHLLGG